MDIVVTVPKSEYKNNTLEDENITKNGHYAFWTLSKVPKQLKEGDRVYFIKSNKIYSSMKVIRIEKDNEMKCETTGRTWFGKCQILMNNFKIENINIITKGFQGFRYKWWED